MSSDAVAPFSAARVTPALRRAMLKTRSVAAVTKPIAEARSCERLAKLRHHEGHVASGARVDDALKLRDYRHLNDGGGPISILVCGDLDPAVAHMLAPKANHITASQASKQ